MGVLMVVVIFIIWVIFANIAINIFNIDERLSKGSKGKTVYLNKEQQAAKLNEFREERDGKPW